MQNIPQKTHTPYFDLLSIRFHVSLLEICGKSMHILIVGKKGMCFRTVKISIPNSKQCQNDWYIFLQWSTREMLIHKMSTRQKFHKIFIANMYGNRHANSRPQTVSSYFKNRQKKTRYVIIFFKSFLKLQDCKGVTVLSSQQPI